MSVPGHNSVAGEKLRAFVERIERVNAEITELNGDKKEIYAEARGQGFDVKILKRVVQRRARDEADVREEDELFTLYWDALQKAPTRAPAREEQKPRQPAAPVPSAPPARGPANEGGRHAAPQDIAPTAPKPADRPPAPATEKAAKPSSEPGAVTPPRAAAPSGAVAEGLDFLPG